MKSLTLAEIYRLASDQLYENGRTLYENSTEPEEDRAATEMYEQAKWLKALAISAPDVSPVGRHDLARALWNLLEGMEASGGWEGDDELFDEAMAIYRRFEKETSMESKSNG